MNGCALANNSIKAKELMYKFINSNLNSESYTFVNEEKKVQALLSGLKYSDNSYIFLYSNLEDISNVTVIIKLLTAFPDWIFILIFLGGIVFGFLIIRTALA